VTNPFEMLKDTPRLLMKARLKPLQGQRFQPTGFADLGPARYQSPTGEEMLLVESAQSVANRMELACCKEDGRTLREELTELPYVCSMYGGELLTTSYLEAHRLSSPYMLNADWAAKLANEMNLRDDYQLNKQSVFKTLLKYDPACLLHGVWFSLKQYKEEFSGGRMRVTRCLSGFIEASGVRVADNGGTKFDRNSARNEEGADAETGYGTLPFHRTEFTGYIVAYFNLDLAQLRGYGLGASAETLLIALALFKIRRFLSSGLRLRTACDLDLDGELTVTKPDGVFTVPDETPLVGILKDSLAACKAQQLFADPPVTSVIYEPKKAKKAKIIEIKLPTGTGVPQTLQVEPHSKHLEVKETGKKKKITTLVFKEGWTNDTLAAVRQAFADKPEVLKSLDEKFKVETEEDEADTDDNEED
jgi:CRISPR-associated protein Csb1